MCNVQYVKLIKVHTHVYVFPGCKEHFWKYPVFASASGDTRVLERQPVSNDDMDVESTL